MGWWNKDKKPSKPKTRKYWVTASVEGSSSVRRWKTVVRGEFVLINGSEYTVSRSGGEYLMDDVLTAEEAKNF